MNLQEALTQLADDLDLDAGQLMAYAQEDKETGWDTNEGDWGIGSLFKSEGQLLYALIRATRPDTVVEFGVRYGCSSKHMLMALVKNRKGQLVSVDYYPQVDVKRFTKAQHKRWSIIEEDVFEAALPQADIVFEDLEHDFELTCAALLLAKDLNPHLVISHDAEHPYVGQTVRTAFKLTLGNVKIVNTFDEDERPDCGFGYWVMENGK